MLNPIGNQFYGVPFSDLLNGNPSYIHSVVRDKEKADDSYEDFCAIDFVLRRRSHRPLVITHDTELRRNVQQIQLVVVVDPLSHNVR